jgi:intracellular sulfur oxidation DsrE/DsrF family protein
MKDTIILVTANGMGNGPEALQQQLIAKYFELLGMQESLPAVICFYTDGVKLVAEDSPVLEKLHALENRGVRLIVCSTCLNYYGLTEKVKAGIVGGMGDILEAQMRAEKVISL